MVVAFILIYFIIAVLVFIVLHGPRAEHLLFDDRDRYDTLFKASIAMNWLVVLMCVGIGAIIEGIENKFEAWRQRRDDQRRDDQ